MIQSARSEPRPTRSRTAASTRKTVPSSSVSEDVFAFTDDEPLSYYTKYGRKLVVPTRRNVPLPSFDSDDNSVDRKDEDFKNDSNTSDDQTSSDEDEEGEHPIASDDEKNSEEENNDDDSDDDFLSVVSAKSRWKKPRRKSICYHDSKSKVSKTPTRIKSLSQSDAQAMTPGIRERLLPRIEAENPLEFARQR